MAVRAISFIKDIHRLADAVDMSVYQVVYNWFTTTNGQNNVVLPVTIADFETATTTLSAAIIAQIQGVDATVTDLTLAGL